MIARCLVGLGILGCAVFAILLVAGKTNAAPKTAIPSAKVDVPLASGPGLIVTEVTPLTGFYRAEDYHQDYALHHPNNPYIQVCDRPKIEPLKQQFPELFIDYKGGTEAKEHR